MAGQRKTDRGWRIPLRDTAASEGSIGHHSRDDAVGYRDSIRIGSWVELTLSDGSWVEMQ